MMLNVPAHSAVWSLLTWFACDFLQVNFGNPFILQIGGEETLAEIKPRIQVIAVCVVHWTADPVPFEAAFAVLLHSGACQLTELRLGAGKTGHNRRGVCQVEVRFHDKLAAA